MLHPNQFAGSTAAWCCAGPRQPHLPQTSLQSPAASHGEALRHSRLSTHAMLESIWADCEGIFPAVLLAIFISICAVRFWQYLAHTVSRVALQFCMV